MINLQSILKENKCKYNSHHWGSIFTDSILGSEVSSHSDVWVIHNTCFHSGSAIVGGQRGQPETLGLPAPDSISWPCLLCTFISISFSPIPSMLSVPSCLRLRFSSSFWRGDRCQLLMSQLNFQFQRGSSLATSCKVGHVPVTLSFRTAIRSQGCCLMLFTAPFTGTFICSSAYFSHVSSSQATKATGTETL